MNINEAIAFLQKMAETGDSSTKAFISEYLNGMLDSNLSDIEAGKWLMKKFGALSVSGAEARAVMQIQKICKRQGFGWVMQIASSLWQDKDPMGALSVGPTYWELKQNEKKNG